MQYAAFLLGASMLIMTRPDDPASQILQMRVTKVQVLFDCAYNQACPTVLPLQGCQTAPLSPVLVAFCCVEQVKPEL